MTTHNSNASAHLAQTLLAMCPRVVEPSSISLANLLERYPLCAKNFSEMIRLPPSSRYSDLLTRRRQTLRTGWLVRGVIHGETVDEHVRGLVRLYRFWQEFSEGHGIAPVAGGTTEEIELMLEVHDDPEGITGDWDREDPERPQREEKCLLERLVMHVVNQGDALGEQRIKAFEDHLNLSLPTAQLAHDLDAIHAVVVAAYYDESLGGGLAIEQKFLSNVPQRLHLRGTLKLLDSFRYDPPLRHRLLEATANLFAEREPPQLSNIGQFATAAAEKFNRDGAATVN